MSTTRTVAGVDTRHAPPPPPPPHDERASARQGRPTGDGWATEHRTPGNVAAEVQAFMIWVSGQRAELRAMLPGDIDIDVFINTAKTAVHTNTDLLMPDYRSSLFIALQRAARQGLLPDKKQGALILRYNSESRKKEVCWQPMVWGVVELGRRTGDLRTFTAQIVYENEPFRILQGEEERYEHERIPECEAKGLAKAIGAYCIITGSDGIKTRRWMGAERIRKVKAASQATKGPWNGPFEDEMWIKTVLLFTMKWVNTNTMSGVFRDAVEDIQDSLEVDLDAAGVEKPSAIIDTSGAPVARRGSRLDQIEQRISARTASAAPALTHERNMNESVGFNLQRGEPEPVPLDEARDDGRHVVKQTARTDAEPTKAPAGTATEGREKPQSAASQRTAPQRARIQDTGFRVFVRHHDGSPGNEGKPITAPMELVRWVEFQLSQVASHDVRALYKENQEAIGLAYEKDVDAAEALDLMASRQVPSKVAPPSATTAVATTAARPEAAEQDTEEQKASKWADDLIRGQIVPAGTMADLNRCTVKSQAFVIRMERYDRDHPAAAAKIRQAYAARCDALKGVGR